MSFSRAILDLVALPLKLLHGYRPRRSPSDPRILIIRRNRMGDMIYTLPLFHALRRHFPQAHLTVACDPPGASIAQACPPVNDVIVLEPGWNPWQAALKNAARLQDYDWVVAAKGGFDRRLAVLTRLTNAAIRIGFERRVDRPSAYYTDPVALPDEPQEEHQIDTLLRLLKPLGLIKPTVFTVDLSLRLPDSAREFAEEILSKSPFALSRPFMLINLSSTVRLKFREEDFIELAGRVLGSTDFIIGMVAAPADQQKAREIALCMASKRITAVDTPGPLDLAALLEHAAFLLTPEGGAAHMAAAVGAPALVLWSEGPFKKWHSRGRKHAFVHAEPGEETIPVERVWQALQPFLPQKENDGLEKTWADSLELPPESGFVP
jgi:ADP-heptose:LPS heptosyltransferase